VHPMGRGCPLFPKRCRGALRRLRLRWNGGETSRSESRGCKRGREEGERGEKGKKGAKEEGEASQLDAEAQAALAQAYHVSVTASVVTAGVAFAVSSASIRGARETLLEQAVVGPVMNKKVVTHTESGQG